jgi:hypothetical protein
MLKSIIEFVKSEYLVYEIITSSLEELGNYMETQNGVSI